MISVSHVLTNPNFTTDFTIERKTGTWSNGIYTLGEPTVINRNGAIQPSSNDELQFLPEGERQNNAISIWCNQEIRMGDGVGINSDVIVYNGGRYKVQFMQDWSANGYWFAIATGWAQ